MIPSPPLLLPLTGSVKVCVRRSVAGSRVKGVYVSPPPKRISISANIQPMIKSTDTMMLPEGDRSKEAIKIYTTTALFSVREGTNSVVADVIEWQGSEWEIVKVVHYQMGVLDHFKALAVRKELS